MAFVGVRQKLRRVHLQVRAVSHAQRARSEPVAGGTQQQNERGGFESGRSYRLCRLVTAVSL